ncbi:MAG: hypothetical protein O2897_05470 [bacterium]|nr:hypothetical protein [bacterium]
MSHESLKIKNQSIAEYAHIKVGFLSGSLTAMLLINAMGITATVSLLDTTFQNFQKIGFVLLIFSTVTAILLCFLAKRYIDSISHRFIYIDPKHMDAIARVAKRFYMPFLLCLMANIFLALLGGVSLLSKLFNF